MPTPSLKPHTQRAHAQLAPSAAYRWINCPGSIKATEGIDEKSSRYAAEGTAAHELANLVLATGIDAEQHLGDFVDLADEQKRIKHGAEANGITVFEITDEMVDAVTVYAEFVRSLVDNGRGVAIIDVEQRLDMRHIHPAIFGTGDAVVYDTLAEHLHVCDFKYGKGHLVSPENNPQLFLYGAGAARRYHNQRLKKISLHVVQPRTPGDPIKSWDTDVLDLFDFESDMAIAAARCFEPDPAIVAGEWCDSGFCPIRATCSTRRQWTFDQALAEFDDTTGELKLPSIADLTPEQRGNIMRAADQIAAFAKAVQEAEHANALAGNMPAGFKLVAKRAARKWRDEEQAIGALILRKVDKDLLFTEPKVKSPAQVETALGKKAFAQLLAEIEEKDGEKLVIKKSSGVNLVPVESPGDPVVLDAQAEFLAIE
jgi:hypothetical protein